MSRVVAITNVTLDGVMQAPARADEDTRGGFAHGGWAAPYAAMQQAGENFAKAGALLFGRRTYQDFHAVWPSRKDSPFTPWLDNVRKYVASRTLASPLPWQNSILLEGDAADAVVALKRQPGGDLLIMGSGELVQALTRRGLVDEYVVLIHPIILGSGRRLLAEGLPASTLRLVESRTTANGVVIATYQPAETPA